MSQEVGFRGGFGADRRFLPVTARDCSRLFEV
jgi:hypothetical protein